MRRGSGVGFQGLGLGFRAPRSYSLILNPKPCGLYTRMNLTSRSLMLRIAGQVAVSMARLSRVWALGFRV